MLVPLPQKTPSTFVSPVFPLESRNILKRAVDACLNVLPVSNCSTVGYGAFDEWDVARITDMRRIFYFRKFFNADLSKWDVSNVANMQHMFYHASSFNADLSNWDVSKVRNMDNMFQLASRFNSDLSKWNVSLVSTRKMFYSATSFNQTLCGED